MQEILQGRAALYAAGVMLPAERAEFELLLEFHEELQAHVNGLLGTVAVAMLAESGNHSPPAALKDRILAAASDAVAMGGVSPTAKVRTDAAGLIEWANEDFTALCGYQLAELRGRKPGALLQGADTDPRAVDALRSGIRQAQPVEAVLINYHKDGNPYRVHVAITPILDDARKPLFYVARERKLPLAATG